MTEALDLTATTVLVHNKHLIQIDALDSLGLRANRGLFEPEETELCRQLIHRGDRVLDIGANIGYYTLLFCDLVAPDGYVSAIEPDRNNFKILQMNLKSQVAELRASLHQLAMGNKNGTALLYHAEENMGMHRMYASVCCSADCSEVNIIRGDSLALAPLDFIKIDIEGYEPFALQGLVDTIKQSPQLKILCEFSPMSLFEAGFSPVAFLSDMNALGFHVLARAQHVWKPTNFSDLTQALQRITPSAIAEFESTVKFLDGNQAIAERCVAFLTQYAYPRPILENLLFVAPGAWQTVCNTLNIDSD